MYKPNHKDVTQQMISMQILDIVVIMRPNFSGPKCTLYFRGAENVFNMLTDKVPWNMQL